MLNREYFMLSVIIIQITQILYWQLKIFDPRKILLKKIIHFFRFYGKVLMYFVIQMVKKEKNSELLGTCLVD